MENHNITNTEIKIIGSFLSNYYSDLVYMSEFSKNVLSDNEAPENYFNKDYIGSFQRFLNGYRVSRCFKFGKTIELFNISKEFILSQIYGKTQNTNNVKIFSTTVQNSDLAHLKKDESGYKDTVSLCSKILFLFNSFYYPYDGNAKKALGYNGTDYGKYYDSIEPKEKIESKANYLLECINKYVKIIEDEFKELNKSSSIISEIDKIRLNRFIDKMLWTLGADNIKIIDIIK